ncbi:MAG: bifunctional (p)ppGpp synthetase/guanosine-3',5'-bis(diphosphate) 3'-pyrophosphohydrolase, partial [Alphaproteobacteria bacterium]|nr:bifunctional (p)ppGpp synthetase/guanosine-3',5'-bis(diphosphate) 3'-pyrophosphohydrolase [Alphaproteobacteria bacterium]
MLTQEELVKRVKSYDKHADTDALCRAYAFAEKKHSRQKRESGEPFFIHPVEVASILTDYHFDCATIMAALLHDVVEDTSATNKDIVKMFGEEVAALVDGVTKLSKIPTQTEHTKQAENFRKLVLATSKDIRVLVIKLADRLHNMRTLHFRKDPQKRLAVAHETMDIYVPLAERIGMHQMKTELENLAFSELNPEAYASICARLDQLKAKQQDIVAKITKQLEKDIQPSGIKATLYGREKTPYSIWRKMTVKNQAFEQICDIMAFRAIVPTVEDCYHILGIIHTKYPMIPGRYRDFISTPKNNGYQSLHTGVIGPFNQRIEIQIRTPQMHEVAELGIAAHWQYKQGAVSAKEGTQFRWMRDLLELLNQSSTSDEFLENTKITMYQDQIFCFSPKGDLIPLPENSTPIDFAYAVHSDIGNHCIGAKVNGEITPLRTRLKNGDQVEILLGKTQTPSPLWERLAASQKAKACIRRFLRNQKRLQLVDMGRALLTNIHQAKKVPLVESDIEKLLPHMSQSTVEDVYVALGEGSIAAQDLFYRMHPEQKTTLKKVAELLSPSKKKPIKNTVDKNCSITGLISGIAVNYAKCCHPVPGDKIVGIVETGKSITIHTANCHMLRKF